MSSALIGGLALGFVIAAGPGPISLLTARRTLTGGWGVGFASGLGVATADATYAAIAVLGVGALSAFLVDQRRLLEIFGGLALIVLGTLALAARRRPARTVETQAPATYAGAYASILGLTLANPSTILSFAAVAAGFNLNLGTSSALFVIGVLFGSALWWLVLTLAVSSLRRRMEDRVVHWLGTWSGGLLVLFGVLATGRGLVGV